MSITLAPTEIVPDHIAAVVARLRQFTNITALCPDEVIGGVTVRRVAARMYAVPNLKDWRYRAAVVQDGGGDGADPYAPIDSPRVDVLCHANTELKASELARIVASALAPVSRRGSSFTAAQCRISSVVQIASPPAFVDRENKTHVRVVSFQLVKSQVPRL